MSSVNFIPSSDIPGLEIIITVMKDGSTFHSIIGESVGKGGTKRAYKITEDLVLLLPSRGLATYGPYTGWNEVVNWEVKASQFLTSVGLLNPKHEVVTVTIPRHGIQIDTYISKSFDGLKRSGMYVLDLKNGENSPPIFYDPNANLYDLNNYVPVFSELVHDIITMFRYRLPYSGDSFNLVSVRTDDINLISPFKIRYFGFDFTNALFGIERRWYKSNKYELEEFVRDYSRVIRVAAENVLYAELERPDTIHVMNYKERSLLMDMIQDYFKPILAELYISNSYDANDEL